MKRTWLIIVFIFVAVCVFADENDYRTLRTFMSAQMYGEAYNELMQRELSGLKLDSKLKSLKLDLLDRTNNKLQKQAKVSPDDATIFTILADIAFQKGDYDRASMYISTAISNNGSAMSNYVFAKILFRKGNIPQAFEQMSKVLEAMPESPVVFNDFQFLYNCKQYGVATARKITKDCTFLMRATPIDYDSDEIEVPASPFDNDPTETEEPPDFSDYNTVSKKKSHNREPVVSKTEVDEDLDELSQIDISLKSDSKKEESDEDLDSDSDSDSTSKSDSDDDSDFDFDFKEEKKEKEIASSKVKIKKEEKASDSDDFDFDLDDIPEKKVVEKKETKKEKIEKKTEPEIKEEDPEDAKFKEAEALLSSAKTKFKNGNVENAEYILKELDKVYPNFPGKQELEDKIKYERDIEKHYKEAKDCLDNDDFDTALKYFKEAYNHDPKKYREAPFYLGQCCLFKENPDEDQALKYYSFIEDDPDLDPEVKRNILWSKFQIYLGQGEVDSEKYVEANKLYNYFKEHESDFLEKHDDHYKYKLWWHLYKFWILLGFSLVIALTVIVFFLQFMPDLAKIGGDALGNAQKALETGKFDKATKYAEKALLKKQPIQLDRQLREVLVQAYFALENYEKCQYHAKIILKSFPENNIAWGYLAKASIENQDTSHEAVKTYEELYKRDPSRKDLLPLLAKHYASVGDNSPAAIEILQDYHNVKPEETEIILALAEGYVKNRTMNEEIIPILNDAIKLKDKIEYRELLARTFSKCGLYEEAARECVNVLRKNINNIGIHVVYTSSMKKLKMVPRAIAQYKEFIQNNPTNNQLIEILEGLKKDEADSSTPVDEMSSVVDDLGMPGMEEEINDFNNQNASTPVPDFLDDSDKTNKPSSTEKVADNPLPEDIQTLDPFADNDSLFEGFDTEELPEELGGTTRSASASSSSLDNLVDGIQASSENKINDSSDSNSSELQKKILDAKNLAVYKKWDQIIDVLTPEFASVRNKDMGMLLVDAWIGKNKPEMALEIIQTLDFDQEMLSDEAKDMMYRTAVALETNKNYSMALKLYDMICNADINYRDAFDRSDKLYGKIKS